MKVFSITGFSRTMTGCLAACLFALPFSASANLIGGNFCNTGFPADVLSPTASAGASPFAQVNWNNITASASGLLLNDNTGTLTTAGLTTTNMGLGSITGTGAHPDEALNDGRANHASGTSWNFSLANIPYANYKIVVYDLQFGAGAVVGINVGATTYYTSSPLYSAAGYLDNNASTPYIYTQGVSTVSTAPTPLSNYVVFSGLSGASQTVTLTGVSGQGARSGGFQIVETVPEPASMAVVGCGVLALLRRRRKA